MDLWSDTNLSPFMAVTAHWIQSTGIIDNPQDGPRHLLKLRSDLVGFYKVPGRHTGSHLAHAFICIIDRLSLDWNVSLFFVDSV